MVTFGSGGWSLGSLWCRLVSTISFCYQVSFGGLVPGSVSGVSIRRRRWYWAPFRHVWLLLVVVIDSRLWLLDCHLRLRFTSDLSPTASCSVLKVATFFHGSCLFASLFDRFDDSEVGSFGI
ncbi:hypothetical protein Bca4012_019893 [Brassica carinata]